MSIGLQKTDRMTSYIRPLFDTSEDTSYYCHYPGDDPLLSPGPCSPGPGYQERGLDGACAVETGYMEQGPDPGALEHLEHMEKPGARSYM